MGTILHALDLLAELGHHLHVGADLPHELLLGLAADRLAQLQRGPQGKPHPVLVHLQRPYPEVPDASEKPMASSSGGYPIFVQGTNTLSASILAVPSRLLG